MSIASAAPDARPALDGLRVVDLSQDRVGAQVSHLLADFGAEVIWIEPPGGSALRARPSFPFLARGKKSVVADPRTGAGRDRVRELAAGADVFIETWRPGVAARLGLDFQTLQRLNPRLIHASITGFGRSGPYANAPGYEGLVAAKLGVNAVFRKMLPGPRPPFVAMPWCSFGASQTALHGVLAALLERERSGHGQWVEANLVQGFATLDTWAWFMYLVGQRWPEAFRQVSVIDDDGIPTSPMWYMLLIALTKDGHWLQFAQVAPHLFKAQMRALGLDWTFTDPAWQGIPVFEDANRRRELWERMLVAANGKTLAEWQAIFDSDPNVYAEQFRGGPQVLAHPQLVHDGHVVDVVDGERGRIRQPGPLVRMEGTPAAIGRSAPRLGEHDDTLALHRPTPAPAPAGAAPSGLPLAGITLLEMAVQYAAPYGTTLLTDLGARVIKIESLQGDPIRTLMPFPESAGAKVMQGKDCIRVDINTPEGLAIVHALARRADGVLQGFRAGVAARIGVDADSLRRINPDFVYLSAAGYGPGPPNGHRPAFAPTAAAAGGIAKANLGGRVPERPGLSIEELRDGHIRLAGAGTTTNAQADGISALAVASALLLGLYARARGHGGQQMHTSMLLTAAHALADHVIDGPGRAQELDPGPDMRGASARYHIYDAADGWVFLAAPRAREWPRLCLALRPWVDLGADPRFAQEADRQRNDTALTQALAAVFVQRGKDDWERDLLAADVGCVAVTTAPIEEILMSDWFGRAGGYLAQAWHPVFEDHPRMAPAVRFSRSATQAPGGHLAGEATERVLRELGYDDARIADLRARRIVD
ncbi:MAG: CaiB/BaiF CoA transferase family protein [Gammaproteobacteria bacterium]